MIFPSHGELASGFGSGSNSSTDILTVMSALITRFQLPPRKQSDMAGVDSTIICTQYDFILACSCLLCCIGEYAVKWGQTNNSNSLILNISRQLFFLSYTCMLILEKHQQTDLICTLCVQLHAVLMQCANSGVGVGQEALMQPRQAWVEFLEPLQYSQRSNLVQASGLLLDWLGSANTDDGDENS